MDVIQQDKGRRVKGKMVQVTEIKEETWLFSVAVVMENATIAMQEKKVNKLNWVVLLQ